MFDKSVIHGIYPPMCTPLTREGQVDEASLHSLVNYLIEGGVHGIFVLGSTGEMTLLTESQRRQVLQITAKAVAGRVPLVAGVFDSSTARCIENALAAKEAGADGVVLTAIYYYRPSQREMIDHFRLVRKAVGLPILAYDIPDTVQVRFETATLKTLADEGTIVGVKDTTGNLEGFRRLLMATRDSGLRVFTGDQQMLDVALRMGAHGGVPGLSNVLPGEYARLYQLAQSGDWQGAARIQDQMCAFFWELTTVCDRTFSSTSAWLGGDKAALKLKGVITSNHVSAPLHSFDTEEEERLGDIMRRYGYL
jgi:4-hydroxy-tetrahydrodipicolinate synthase